MKFSTITHSKFFKPAVGALVLSLGLQIVVVLLGTWQIGNLAGFRYVLNFIYTLILVPYMLAVLTASNTTRFSGNAIETLSWAIQAGVWFLIFFVLLSLRSRSKKEA